MKKTILFLLFVFISYFAYNQDISSDFVQFYYPNGKVVSSEGFMVDGKPDGYWKSYYENGNLKSEGNRKNFLLDGEWKFYQEDGSISQLITYSEGKKNGKRITYTSEYVLEENFSDNTKEGMSYVYDIDNHLVSSVSFSNGVENGMKKEFAEDGRIIRITDYNKGFIISSEWINRMDGSGRKQGKWLTFHDNGNIATVSFYLNDKLNGYVKHYDEDGKLTDIEKYDSGKKEELAKDEVKADVRKEYYSNGKIKTIATYKNGLPEGIRREYDEKGNISGSYVFEHGKIVSEGIIDEQLTRHGPWKDYYNNGNVKAEGKYNNGLRVGQWSFYNIDGNIEQEGEYDDKGRYTGSWVFYYPSGNILKEESYIEGKEYGMYVEYSDEGMIIVQGNYNYGMKEGKWTYSINGIVETGEYLNDKKDGYWTIVFDDGAMLEEGSFIEDNPDGEYRWYYTTGPAAGKICLIGKYINGQRNGDWIYFDEEGNIELIVTYNDGDEVE